MLLGELMRDTDTGSSTPFCDDCYPLELLLWLQREQQRQETPAEPFPVEAMAA
ncbi:hypothetical protein [Zobellella taiwanensis]